MVGFSSTTSFSNTLDSTEKGLHSGNRAVHCCTGQSNADCHIFSKCSKKIFITPP